MAGATHFRSSDRSVRYFYVGYLLIHQPVYFAQWHKLFDSVLVKIATLVTLIAIIWHAWIGLWTVLTDYIKHTGLRLVLQSLVIILLLGYVFWGVGMCWFK